MDKIVTEVARRAVKEFLENLMNTERDVFLMENNGQKNGYYNACHERSFVDLDTMLTSPIIF